MTNDTNEALKETIKLLLCFSAVLAAAFVIVMAFDNLSNIKSCKGNSVVIKEIIKTLYLKDKVDSVRMERQKLMVRDEVMILTRRVDSLEHRIDSIEKDLLIIF